jgi:ABC-2 type transport system permease protein
MDTLHAFLYKIICIIRKEFLATVKDPKSRAILIFPVLIQGLLFGYTATYNLDSVPYAVLDQSHSKYSDELLARLDGSGIFQRVRTLANADSISEAIDSGDAMLVIQIQPRFANQLTAGETAPIQVITDGKNPMTSGIASSYVSAIVSSYNINQLHQGRQLIHIQTIARYNPNLITRWMFLPSLLPVLALTQVLMLAGLSVAREREQGIFDQLLVTPLRPREILIGKAVPPIVIGLLQATLMLCLITFWFGIHLVGSLLTLYLTILIFLISCVGIGLSISAVAKNMQQVMVYCFVFMLPMILLSGLATPIHNMPDILQYVTYINPMRFTIEAIRRIYLEGAGLSLIAYNYIPMLVVASITLPLASWLFRHKLS